MIKPAYGEVIAKIRAMCARPEGVSQQELMSAMGGKSQSAVSRALDRMGDAIVKAGVKDYHCYFTDKQQAAEYQVIAEIDRERRIKESIEKTRIAEKIRMQKRRDHDRILVNQRKQKMKAAPGEVINKIRALCKQSNGTSIKEVTEVLKKRANTISSYLAQLVRNKEAFKAGAYGMPRYFSDKETAEKHEKLADESRNKRLEERRKRKNEAHSRRQKAKRAKAREESGLPKYFRVLEKKPKARKMPQNIVIQSKQQAIDQLREHKAATIVWPDNVVIQKIPAPEDTRFKPDPDYKGHFVKEFGKLRENPYMQA